MVRHCVVVSWSEDASEDQKQAAIEAIAALPARIPEIHAFSVGTDLGLGAGNGDTAIVADFQSVADYKVYATHPDHVQVIQDLVKPILASRAAVQFEF